MICTYLSGDRHAEPTKCQQLNELLADVRKTTGKDWRVAEHEFERTYWFRKSEVVFRYELLVHICAGEFQCINFHRDGTTWSINTTVPAELVIAFLFGILAGHKTGGFTRALTPPPSSNAERGG